MTLRFPNQREEDFLRSKLFSGNIVIFNTLSYARVIGAVPEAQVSCDPIVYNENEEGISFIPIWSHNVVKGISHFDADLQIDIPKKLNIHRLSVNFSIHVMKNGVEIGKVKEEEIISTIQSSGNWRICRRGFSFDDGRDQGSGPFALGGNPNRISCEELEKNKYLDDDGNFVFIVLITNVVKVINKYVPALNVFEKFAPDLFKEQRNALQLHLDNLANQSRNLKNNIMTKSTFIESMGQTMLEDKEFHEANSLNNELSQKNEQIQAMIRSDHERAAQLQIRLKTNNFNHFLKTMGDLKDGETRDKISSDLDQLSYHDLLEIHGKLIKLKQLMYEEIDEQSKCGICVDAPLNMALVPCGHRSFCNECTSQFASFHKLCPKCCQPYTDMIQLKF